MKEKKSILNFFFLLFGLILVSGCNQTFEPLQENENYHFSIYGYLDAAADTQWVRIGTARKAIDQAPDPSGISVTLENIQSGETVEMQDSLFTTENFLNFWTTFDIENEQTYRIKVEATDGKFSYADVTTPIELPTPLVFVNTFPPYGYTIYIDDVVGHVADIQTKWYVILNPETDPVRKVFTFTYRPEMEHVEVYSGSFTAFAPLEDEEGHIEASVGINDYEIVHRQVFVAAAGPQWDDEISSIGDLEYFINSTSSNVVNGLGYVVGTDSKWVPYRTCKNAEESLVVPCPEEAPLW